MFDLYYSVTLEVTRRCNLACIFCGVRENTSPILDIEKVATFLSTIKKPLFLFVTGGEPLLVPYVPEIRKYLKSIDIKQLGINTNGTLVIEDSAKKLVTNYDLIEVSIDGPKIVHDQLRGLKGTYDKAINALKLLIKAKKRLKKNNILVGINTVITVLSIDNILEFFNYILSLGVDVIQFTPMLYDTNSEIFKKYGLKPEHASKLNEVYDYLKNLNVLAPGMNEFYLKRVIDFVEGKYYPPSFCGTGKYFVHISAEGKLYPCCSFYPRFGSTITIDHKFDMATIEKEMYLIKKKVNSNVCDICLNLYNSYLDAIYRTLGRDQ